MSQLQIGSMNCKKEAIDQPLHFLWAGVTFAAPWVAIQLPVGRVPLLVVAALSLLFLCAREVWQKRFYTGGIFGNWPWLDSTFYALGAVAGTVGGVFL
jgi:hypothetical protein